MQSKMKMTYGHENSIMILVAEKMGLNPTHTEAAASHLEGGELHPMTAAAMEREAIRINDQLRHDAESIARANYIADEVKAKYGFATQRAQSVSQ